MNIIPEKTEIYDRIKESMYTDEGEFEVLVNKHTGISRQTFIRLLEYCRSNNYYEYTTPEMLDIRTLFKTHSDKSILSHTRASILGKLNIKKYCETDDLNVVEKFNIPADSTANNIIYLQKSNYFKKSKDGNKAFFNSVINDDYNYKINLKREVQSNEYNLANFKETWTDKLKMFRYKKRFSFRTRDALFRIDLTIVKESKKEKNGQYILTKTFRESNTLLNPEIYELEIEYIGSQNDSKVGYPIINQYVNQIIANEEIKLENVLKLATYNNLYRLQSKIEKIEFSDIYNVKNEFKKSSKKIILKTMKPKEEKELVQLIIEILNYHLFNLLTIVNNSIILLSNKQKEDIINGYRDLTDDHQDEYRNVMMTPQPVTLTLEHLSDTKSPSILMNYSVTEKADGDRFLLYIDGIGDAYLLNLTGVTRYNSRTYMNIIPTSVKFKKLKNVIIDGEYVTRTIDDKPIKLFLYFDVYVYPGTKDEVFKMPFLTSDNKCRMYFMDRFENEYSDSKLCLKDEHSIMFEKKTYYHGGNKIGDKILRLSNNILKKAKEKGYAYHIDGLIYIPSNLSVKAESVGEIKNTINGTWSMNFKWKPPEENTIDFMVESRMDAKKNREKIVYSVNEETNVIDKFKQFYLKVGYNENDDLKTEFYLKTLRGEKKSRIRENIYFNPNDSTETEDGKINSDLHITNVGLKNGRAFCTKDKLEIGNGDIIEFKYLPDASNNCKWVPIRKRPDKQVPQYYKIANQVWDTICNPVSEDMISGKVALDKIRPLVAEYVKDKSEFSHENLYYIGKSRESSLSRPLLDYHNYVKYALISGICEDLKYYSGDITLLDTSCGRGGDLKKWLSPKNKIKFILGLDISRDISEAAKRLYNSKEYNSRFYKTEVIFAMSDTSKNIENGDSLKIEDIDLQLPEMRYSKNILNILYNRNLKDIPESYSDIKAKYTGKAQTKFKIISSQFSVHYYFKNIDTLQGYIKNITDNIEVGGYFIGTCYDGKRVYDTLNKGTNGGKLEYIEDGDKVYSITRDYTGVYNNFVWEEDIDSVEKYLGHKIKVYMETIGQEISEYLVNFEMFEDLMIQKGFKLDSPMGSGSIFNNSGIGDFEEAYKNFLISDDVDKNGNAKYMGDNFDLSQLSFLNNWFVFKKIN